MQQYHLPARWGNGYKGQRTEIYGIPPGPWPTKMPFKKEESRSTRSRFPTSLKSRSKHHAAMPRKRLEQQGKCAQRATRCAAVLQRHHGQRGALRRRPSHLSPSSPTGSTASTSAAQLWKQRVPTRPPLGTTTVPQSEVQCAKASGVCRIRESTLVRRQTCSHSHAHCLC